MTAHPTPATLADRYAPLQLLNGAVGIPSFSTHKGKKVTFWIHGVETLDGVRHEAEVLAAALRLLLADLLDGSLVMAPNEPPIRRASEGGGKEPFDITELPDVALEDVCRS